MVVIAEGSRGQAGAGCANRAGDTVGLLDCVGREGVCRAVTEYNALLRAARERLPSRAAPGEHLTRAELADAVNAWLWEATRLRYELDDHLIGKWERGAVRWPIAPYRSALRAVLGVGTDAELGFRAPTRRRAATSPPLDDGRWTRGTIVADAATATEWDVLNRRDAVRGAVALGGAGLVGPLARWLEPLVDGPLSARNGAFAVAEVDAIEHVVAVFRGWRSPGSGLGRTAVVGQLSDVAERLDGAPADALTDRVFLAGAELAKIAGSMAFDGGLHRVAQQHYVTAARMAKASGCLSFGAVALAALARQSFDLGSADDGLEIVHMAQRGTGDSATPALRSMLATREAWGHAQRGAVHAFRRAVDVAEQSHSEVDAGHEPRWLRGLDSAELAGTIGARYRELARHDARQAHHAVDYLNRALTLRGADKGRNRAFDLVALARVHLMTDEPDHAAATVVRAFPMLDGQRPGRLARKLTDWTRESARYGAIPSVRESRAAIGELTGATV